MLVKCQGETHPQLCTSAGKTEVGYFYPLIELFCSFISLTDIIINLLPPILVAVVDVKYEQHNLYSPMGCDFATDISQL